MSSCLRILLTLALASTTHAQTTLTVAAAADLSNVQPNLALAFTQGHPEIAIRWVTGASGVLSQQIENGAPYDVFLSANAAFVEKLVSAGILAKETAKIYAVGEVGLLWKDGKPHPLDDLATDRVRVFALPNPKLAPYGAAAVEALRHEGLWEKVQAKAVLSENVRQALEIFDSGNADAVLTSASLLKGRPFELVRADWHLPIRQMAAMLSNSKNPEPARQFLAFLSSPGGQAVFARFGFSPARQEAK